MDKGFFTDTANGEAKESYKVLQRLSALRMHNMFKVGPQVGPHNRHSAHKVMMALRNHHCTS
jgi:hypothetical protein